MGPPAWISDSVFYASSSVGREFAAIVRHDLDAGETTTVPGTGEQFDAEVVAAGDAAITVIENRDGASAMWHYDLRSGERGDVPLPEDGSDPRLVSRAADRQQATSGSRPLLHADPRRALAGDVYSRDRESGETRRLTHSPTEVTPDAQLA